MYHFFQDIAKLHLSFSADIDAAVCQMLHLTSNNNNNVTCPRLGEVFLRWKMKFVAYSVYCAELPASQTQIDRLCAESPATRQCILVCFVYSLQRYADNKNKFCNCDKVAYIINNKLI